MTVPRRWLAIGAIIHGKVHIIVFVVAALATIVAPFVLARRMRDLPAWQDWARPTRAIGVLTIVGLGVSGDTTGTAVQGWSQRVAAIVVVSGLAALAWQVRGRTCSVTMSA